MTSRTRHAAPVWITHDGTITPLKRHYLGQSGDDDRKREKFIQDLVHDHPESLPMTDIEPAFAPLISVCQELPIPGGYVDNLWLTPAGGLVLGECKLVRNPEARREVVAQVLDYARAVSAWTFVDLERAVSKAQAVRTGEKPGLWSLVEKEGSTDLDEAQFVDAIERRLRTGRLLLLVIGDGIQEGVEALTEHLQLHAGIHAGMALVDLSVWSDPSGGRLVVPRVPMRTVLIERGIVTFDPTIGVKVQSPASTSAAGPRPVTASEPEFFEQFRQRRPDLLVPLRDFLGTLGEIGVEPLFRRSVVLRFRPSPDIEASAGYVERGGAVQFGDGWRSANNLGKREAGDAYLQTIAELIGGRVISKPGAALPWLSGADGKTPDLATLLKKPDAWSDAMRKLVEALQVDE